MNGKPPGASALLNRLLTRGKFRHMQVLLKLAEVGTVQGTAEAIGMSQPSVTQALAYVERLIGVKLFERHAKGVRPTPACSDLLPAARHILLGVADCAEAITARHSRGQTIVRVVASVSAMHGLLVGTLSEFGRRHPTVQVHLTEAEGDDQLLAIARGEADLVACRRPPQAPEGWDFMPLLDDRLTVVCRRSHPLATIKRVTWQRLKSQTWLLSPSGTAARGRLDSLFVDAQSELKTSSIITRTPTMLWWMLRHENALAFLPRNFVKPLIDANEVVELDVRPASPMESLGLLLPDRGRTQAAMQLSRHLQEHFKASG